MKKKILSLLLATTLLGQAITIYASDIDTQFVDMEELPDISEEIIPEEDDDQTSAEISSFQPSLFSDGNDLFSSGPSDEWSDGTEISTTSEGVSAIPSSAQEWNGHYYQIYDTPMNWYDAKEYCENLGGHLVTITSQDEQTEVESILNGGSKNFYWLGMERDTNGSFSSWVTGESVGYTHFDTANGEPNNYTGNENVLVIYRIANPKGGSDGKFKWNDLQADGDCEGEEFFGAENSGFICEWENSGFTLGVDNNNFVHTSSSNLVGAGFAGVKDYTISDTYFKRLTSNSTKSEKNKIKKQMKNAWGGACYGIAMSMGLLYENYIDLSDLTEDASAQNYYSMSYPCNNTKLLNTINYYQLSQSLKNGGKKAAAVSTAYNNGWFTGLVNWICDYDSLSVCLEKLVNYASTDHVELLGFSSSKGGHAVLITGCEYDEDTEQYNVQIYDENSVNSATSKGEFSYMTIQKDFSAFSYTDANGEKIDNDTYISLYVLDWNSLGNVIATTAQERSSGHAKLDFLVGDDFKVANAEGDYIKYNDSKFSGTMNIYDIATAETDDGVHIIIETDDTQYVTVSDLESSIDIEFYDDNKYLALQSQNLDMAKLTLGDGIELQGDSYSFTAYVGMDEISADEDGLLSVTADAKSDTSIIKKNNELEVDADKALTNITTTDYTGVETNEKQHEPSNTLNISSNNTDSKKDSSIVLKNKSVTFSGKGVPIGNAIVTGSKGKVEYHYYSDSNCTKKISGLPVNVGTYYVKATVAADQKYNAATSNIAKLIINKAKLTNVSLEKTAFVYNGRVQKPSIIVKDNKGKQVKSSAYSVVYSKGCKNVGVYTVQVTLKGNYEGRISKKYTIVPKGTSIAKIAAKSKGFTISWKKQAVQVNGYQIQYSTNSKFTSAKTLAITKNKTVSKTVAKLRGKKKYYVRVRTYKSIKGKKLYSPWSKTKSIVTKK